MITRLSGVLGADIGTLLSAAVQNDESPQVIIVDDSKVILSDSLPVLEEVFPDAVITGFIRPREAAEYAKANHVALAIQDIELGTASGLILCRTLLEINPHTNIVFLTAYPDYALDAWKTEACGFMVKPLTPERVREQLKKLRFPFSEELEHTRAYLAVEQAQHEEILVVEYDTQFTQFRLPPLTLQPLAENAVKHGMNPDAGPLHVTIRTCRTDKASMIVVEDNGPGFDASEMNETHTTLANIRQRLEWMCGGKMEIMQRESGGTKVTVTIPDRKTKELRSRITDFSIGTP